MTRPETTGTAAPAQPAWRLQLGRVAIGIAAAAVLFLLGWMMGRGPAADLERERDEAELARVAVDAELKQVRVRVRELGQELDKLVNRVHGNEMARTEQRLRLEQMEQRALEEFGVEGEALVAEYGPDAPVPGEPPVPYVREEQERRLAKAEKRLDRFEGKLERAAEHEQVAEPVSPAQLPIAVDAA